MFVEIKRDLFINVAQIHSIERTPDGIIVRYYPGDPSPPSPPTSISFANVTASLRRYLVHTCGFEWFRVQD
jgi:hypothetical protein